MATKRCSQCVLPESYPGIDFDEAGRCHLCRSYQKPVVKGEHALKRQVSSRKGERYDVLLTLSGGRDSSYVLYYAAKVLGLRVLAITYNNGFRHPQAEKNIYEAGRRLGVEIIECTSRNQLNKRITAETLHATIPHGPGPTLQFMCRACYNGGLAFLYSIAHEKKIPFIFWGDSAVEKLSFVPIRHKALGMVHPGRVVFSPHGLSFIKFLGLLLAQRNEKLPPGNSPFSLKFPKLKDPNIGEIHFFDYVEWDRNEIKQIIREELGWEKPPDSISSWRFDCHLHSLVNYCHKKAIGFNHDIDGLSNMIRAGKMTRGEAMNLIEKGFDSGEWTDKMEHVCKRTLKLSDSEITTMKTWQTPVDC